jgi:hypothetical protein
VKVAPRAGSEIGTESVWTTTFRSSGE